LKFTSVIVGEKLHFYPEKWGSFGFDHLLYDPEGDRLSNRCYLMIFWSTLDAVFSQSGVISGFSKNKGVGFCGIGAVPGSRDGGMDLPFRKSPSESPAHQPPKTGSGSYALHGILAPKMSDTRQTHRISRSLRSHDLNFAPFVKIRLLSARNF
jgi:hypothetical protein